MKWYVNNVDITTLPEWSGLFDIDTVGSTRGSIEIRKNLTPGSDVTMRFEAVLVDNRLGVNIPIRSDEITLSTVDASNDGYNMTIGEDKGLRYNPLLDKLLLYEYKVAHGLISPSSAGEAAARDGNEYQRTFPIEVFKGETKITTGFTVKLYKVNSATSITEVTSSDYEVVSVSTSAIVMDLRLISKADYMVKAFSPDTTPVELARVQFSIDPTWTDSRLRWTPRARRSSVLRVSSGLCGTPALRLLPMWSTMRETLPYSSSPRPVWAMTTPMTG